MKAHIASNAGRGLLSKALGSDGRKIGLHEIVVSGEDKVKQAERTMPVSLSASASSFGRKVGVFFFSAIGHGVPSRRVQGRQKT